jgi:hypothetical protein
MDLCALALWCQSLGAPRFAIEDPRGQASELTLDVLPLTDPRTRQAWILRPLGFAAPKTEVRAGERVELTLLGGDELWGVVRGGAKEELSLEPFEGVVVPFAIESLLRLEFPARVPAEARGTLRAPSEGDRLYRLTSTIEPLDGTLDGFTDEGVRFSSVLGERTFPWSEVAVLCIEPLDSSPKALPKDTVPVVVTLGGSARGRLRGPLVALEEKACRLRLLAGTEIAVPLHAVAEILVADGRLVFVSELTPAREELAGTPFDDGLGMTWPHRVDASVMGGPLEVAGLRRSRGLGVHAPSRLSYALDGSDQVLRGSVGVDDSALANAARARGSVVFRVLADGAKLWESALLRGGDPAVAMPVLSLAGKHELVLEVDPAGDFAGDRADWLDLVLAR